MAPQFPSTPVENILEEANRLIFGERRSHYGHPLDDYTRTAAIFNAVFADKIKTPFTPEDLMMVMVCVKISRHTNLVRRDNLVDIAGYAGCIQEAIEERGRRESHI
jgi:hypothetical protein